MNWVVPQRGKSVEGVKPWRRLVTVVIPHINTPDILELCVKLWKRTKPQPQIMIVDTGSSAAVMKRVERLRASNVEVHRIAAHGWRHTSEPVAAAMDLATQLTQTRYMLATHADAFPRQQCGAEQLIRMAEANSRPVVGYQISPRPHWKIAGKPCDDWQWMAGHTFTLFDVPFLDRHNVFWSLRRGAIAKGWDYTFDGNHEPNVIDTETFMNYQIRAVGQPALLIGTEENYQRNITYHFDHVRSFPSAQLYLSSRAELSVNHAQWMAAAVAEARDRVRAWGAAPAEADPLPDSMRRLMSPGSGGSVGGVS